MEQLKTYRCWTTSLDMTSKNAVIVNAPNPLCAAYDYAEQLVGAGHTFDALDVFVLMEKDRRLHRFRITGGNDEQTLCGHHA